MTNESRRRYSLVRSARDVGIKTLALAPPARPVPLGRRRAHAPRSPPNKCARASPEGRTHLVSLPFRVSTTTGMVRVSSGGMYSESEYYGGLCRHSRPAPGIVFGR